MLLDAYTVRKAIPRILIAVIGINISIYLCVGLVDVVNVIGGGIARLISQPFIGAELNSFGVPLDASSAVVGGVGLYAGGAAMTGAISSAIGAVAVGGISVVTGALAALFFLMIPVLLLALAILCVVVLRQALLFFLIVISPVAIAFFVLPGTEKYFQKWWDLFTKTLLVYPIIAVMFAISDVFASIIFSTSTSIGIATIVTGIVVIFAPLFLIPFAFKLAGGAISALSNFATGSGTRLTQMGPIKNRREYYGQRTKDNMVRGGAEQYRRSSEIASDTRRNWGRRQVAGWRAKRISGYKADIFDRESAINEAAAKHLNDITGHGDDSLQRAYTVDKDAADRSGEAGEGKLWKIDNDNGQRLYRTAGGKWVTETDVDESRRKYGARNTTQLQQSLAYEMRKATSQEEQDNIVRNFGSIADSWGMSDNQANGVWIGAGFANQQDNLQWKHGRWQRDDSGNFVMSANGDAMIKEVDEKKGSYEASRYNADTWTTMSKQVKASSDSLNTSRVEKSRLEAIATRSSDEEAQLQYHNQNIAKQQETLQRAARVVSSIRTEQPMRDPEGNVIPGRTMEVIGAGAAGRTQEEMRAFANVADQYAGKYTEQTGYLGPTSPPRPAGFVEDSMDNRDTTRRPNP